MDQPAEKDELETEIHRGNFTRAVALAESRGLTADRVAELKVKALWQMSAVNRNAPGTRRLADTYGFNKERVREILAQLQEKAAQKGDRSLEPCYDHATRKYLSFEQWLEQFLKNWDRLAKS